MKKLFETFTIIICIFPLLLVPRYFNGKIQIIIITKTSDNNNQKLYFYESTFIKIKLLVILITGFGNNNYLYFSIKIS